MPKSLLILFVCSVTVCGCQSKKETAQKNFEKFFASFKAAYPADHFEYHFSGYSDLHKLPKPIPFDQPVKNGMVGKGPIVYSQTVHCVSFDREGDTLKNNLFIEYNGSLEVVSFGTLQAKPKTQNTR